ncbi:hypothetical protein GCM10020255_051990 [Rhodococcus baikonurensis]
MVESAAPEIGGFQDEGFWVVTRHEEVKEVSQRSDIFSTHENTAIPRFADDIPRENVEMQRFILINKDAPEHTKLRKLVSRGFTPRAINSLREELTERAEKIVTTAAAGGAGDFVVQVASELPLQAIAELLGVPQEDRMKLFDWSNQMTSYDDPSSTSTRRRRRWRFWDTRTRWRISARSVPPMTSSPSSSKRTSTEMSSPQRNSASS